MLVTVTAKIKIKPAHNQIQALQETIRAYRQGCNLVSVVVYRTSELKLPALHQLTYRTLRSMIGLRSQMAQSVMKTVMARYKTNQSNGHDRVRVKFKKPEYDLVWNRDYSLTKDLFANTLFVLEDLKGVRHATEKARVKDRYVTVSWAFHQLRKMVEYKAQLAGSMIIAVNPAYTSQTCPKCGCRARSNRNKRKHHFRCIRCGYQSND